MAVNLSVPVASELKPVSGLELGYAKASIKKENRKDLLVMRPGSLGNWISGVFTRNRFCSRAGSDMQNQSGKKRMRQGKISGALMVNTEMPCRSREADIRMPLKPVPLWRNCWIAIRVRFCLFDGCYS